MREERQTRGPVVGGGPAAATSLAALTQFLEQRGAVKQEPKIEPKVDLEAAPKIAATAAPAAPPTAAPAPAVGLLTRKNQKRASLTLTQQTQRLRVG